MRIIHMIGLATALFALAACDGGPPNDDPAGLLTESDLSTKVEAQSTVTQPPPLTPWCSLEFGGIFGPGFDIEGRSFETADGTIVTTVSRLPGRNLTADRLAEMRRQTQICVEGDGDAPRITVLELPADQFGYTVTDESGQPAGSIGFALADQAYVSVAIVADRETQGELTTLLDKAVERADEVTG